MYYVAEYFKLIIVSIFVEGNKLSFETADNKFSFVYKTLKFY